MPSETTSADSVRDRPDADDADARHGDARTGAKRRWLATGTCVAVIAAGVLGYFAIGWLAGEPEPRDPGPQAPLVESTRVRPVGALSVSGTGFVRAAQTLSLSAEVRGRVARVSPQFRVGRRIPAGTALVELERARFEADVNAAKARLDGARARRNTAASNVRRQRSLEDEGFAAGQRLEEVETAQASAQAEVALAESQLELARIALDDTVLDTPYEAIVSASEVSLGQIVSPGTSVGELVAADSAEIRIGLLPRQRTLLASDRNLVGRTVEVFSGAGPGDDPEVGPDADGGSSSARRQVATGRIAAIDPVLDPVARTLGLVIDVPDPFADGALKVGELVEVVIPIPGTRATVYELPVRALKGADRLWVIDAGKLRPVDPSIVRRDADRVQVTSRELAENDRVLVTDLAAAVEGLAVRLADEGAREGGDGSGGGGTGDGDATR